MAFAGQLSKYKPEYDEMLIEHMQKGYSFESFGGVIGVHKETLYEWANVHPDFSEAKKCAFAQNLLWWERQGITGLWEDKEGLKLSPALWVFNMKARHKWRDNSVVEEQKVEEPKVITNLPVQDKEPEYE